MHAFVNIVNPVTLLHICGQYLWGYYIEEYGIYFSKDHGLSTIYIHAHIIKIQVWVERECFTYLFSLTDWLLEKRK